jgi:hypothetical protein
MLYLEKLDTKLQLNLGELVEPLLVFLVFQEEEHIELVKQLLVICAEEVECLPQQRFGENGTDESV